VLFVIGIHDMKAEDVIATLEYGRALAREFEENHAALRLAEALGSARAVARHEKRARSLYAELSEVRHALKTGYMPY
jgi:hypothetical protein